MNIQQLVNSPIDCDVVSNLLKELQPSRDGYDTDHDDMVSWILTSINDTLSREQLKTFYNCLADIVDTQIDETCLLNLCTAKMQYLCTNHKDGSYFTFFEKMFYMDECPPKTMIEFLKIKSS